MAIDGEAIYKRLKFGRVIYNEEVHCPLLLNILGDPEKGTLSAFCCAAFVGPDTFYKWVKEHEFFAHVYGLGRLFAKEIWEEEGRALRFHQSLPGAQDCRFELWRYQGWARFGIGKNSRIRLELDPDATPIEHYKQLIKQAGQGDFTAGEFKQLIEGINVGLSAHQVFTMQKEIDQLKCDLVTMTENSNVQNSFTNPGVAQKD